MAEGNPFAAELSRRKGNPFAAELERRKEGGGSEAFGLSLSQRFTNNALALPSATGELLLKASAGVATGADRLIGGDTTFDEMLALGREKSILDDIPRPTVEGIGAAVRSVPALMPGGQSFGERFRDEKIGIEADLAGMREAHPVASGAGEIGGDAATLVLGRLPGAKAINQAESALLPRAEIFFGRAVPKVTDPGARRFVQRVIDSKSLRQLARGAGRSVESGFEAAALDVLHGDDPLETAGYVAGAQAGGSFLLHAGKGLLTGGPTKVGLKIGLAATATGAIWQTLKSATPGGRDFILESIETGFDKVTFGMALGAVAGAVGSGRLRGGRTAEDFPKITDAIATIPRATAIATVESLVNADPKTQRQAEIVLAELSRNPMAFGEDAMKRLNTAMERGQFIEELNKLKRDRDFQEKLFSLQPDLSAGGF